jgi:hypothetical protein
MTKTNYIVQTTWNEMTGTNTKTLVLDRNGPLGPKRYRMKKNDLIEEGFEHMDWTNLA